MSNATTGGTAPTRPGEFQPAFVASMAALDGLMRTQHAQLEALATWQHSIAAINQELWDEWVCHWGGGVPIDA
jgi:hypothetical protein